MKNGNKRSGFGLTEIIIGAGIISVSIFSFAAVSGSALRIVEESTKNIQAAFLAEEGVEAVKVLRDSGWSENIESLNTETYYYLVFSNGNWVATTSDIYIDGFFERKFMLEDVNRDINDDIVETGGVVDFDTKKLIVIVSWRSRTATTTSSISTYITNFFNN